MSTVARTLMLLGAAACLNHAATACPEVNRLVGPYQDGQVSVVGGAVPNGARAADDFQLPLGNGNNYSVRLIKYVMISNFVITPTNVNLIIYSDGTNGTYSIPNAQVAGTPNVPPHVRQIGTYNSEFRLYEVSYAIPTGFLTLTRNAWYWLSPQAVAPAGSTTGVAYVAVPNTPTVVGAIACAAAGVPPGTRLGPWTSIDVCCVGARDLAIYVDAVQAGSAFADFNCDLVLSVQDIFEFLAAWFAGAPEADVNGADGVGAQDIFDFLMFWFTGG